MEILRMMLFGSHPSVYTLPGTWEAQPMVPTDILYNTTIAMASFGIIAVTATAISMLALRGKRKRV
tara:strand:- start:460 stop:657 length:198 start_codon:yes stop_codon:yes gene_type:complete